VKENEMSGACNTQEELRNAYKILVGKLEGKEPLKRISYTWEVAGSKRNRV
jgi:hypothetical protein